MLFVVADYSGYKEFSFHIGEPLLDLDAIEISKVQADGDELDYIMSNFPSVPLAFHTEPSPGESDNRKVNRVQQWFGDDAKFIYHNLQWKFNLAGKIPIEK